MKISDFAGCLKTVELTLPNGAKVTARELSAADDRAIRDAMPPPLPPMVKDPGKGSAAPKVPQTTDPAYVSAFNEWFSRRSVVRLAAAMGWENRSGRAWDRTAPAEIRAAWCAEAVSELSAAMSVDDLNRLYEAYTAAADGEDDGVGLGNSGSGSDQAPT